MERYDVTVIGAGVVGCAVARELTKYDLSVLVIEKEEDVCSGTSKANSGIAHAGYDAPAGSVMAAMNVRGNALIHELSRTLDFPFTGCGSLVVCFDEERRGDLETLRERGEKNGVEGLCILSGDQARAMEPALSPEVMAALYAPSAGVVCPFLMTAAFAENAAANGAQFRFLTEVTNIIKKEEGFLLSTDRGEIAATCVVNAAGVYADRMHNLVSTDKLSITPRRGEYVLLDREVGTLVGRTIFQLPGKLGKGVLVTPTAHGNLLVGPNARDLDDKENVETTAEGLDEIKSKALRSVPGIPYRAVITAFAGLRAHEAGGDFVIGEVGDCPGFFDAAGIESPGLTSAPAIGEALARQIAEKLNAPVKAGFIATRKGFVQPAKLPPEVRAALIKERPDYGRIVCRCENVSEGEIVDAIRRVPGAVSLDGIKRRVRQGMGRCQAGFCTPRAMEILARELGVPMEQVAKNRPGSELLREEGDR